MKVFIFSLLVIFEGYSPSLALSKEKNTGNLSADKHPPQLDIDEMKELAVSVSETEIQRLESFEYTLNQAVPKDRDSPFYHQLVDYLPSSTALNVTKDAFLAVKSSVYLVSALCHEHGIWNEDCISLLSSIKFEGTNLQESCDKAYEVKNCDNIYNFRSIDGSCNNANITSRGRSNTPYRRLLNSAYDDGVFTLRGSTPGPSQMAGARFVSTTVSEVKHVPEKSKSSAALTFWGLLVGHDLAHTPASNMIHINTPVACCDYDGKSLPPRHKHVFCAPIFIPETDEFYAKHDQRCMNYVRSLPAFKRDCTFGAMEQLNQATHFLDASFLYGSTLEKMRSLRSGVEGRLATTTSKHEFEYPPLADPSEMLCGLLQNKAKCYNVGDTRVNSQHQLQILHTILLREHNRIAAGLAALNGHWDDEKLFQETRKIVIAEIQHITYQNWLPHVIGKVSIQHSPSLKVPRYGYSNVYDKRVDASVSNEFATAALPFLYSMMDDIKLYSEERNESDVKLLKEQFVKGPYLENRLYFDDVIRGLATQKSQKVDLLFAEGLRQYWYSPTGQYGMDLLSLDIQRGRDHGLAPYHKYREMCNLSSVLYYRDMQGAIPDRTIVQLKKAYAQARDVDLLVGIMSETKGNKELGLLPPTLKCILMEQFSKTRIGDRFFYDNSDVFTKDQLDQIRKVTLSRILCDNSHSVAQMQRDVFKIPEPGNTLHKCDSKAIPSIDLKHWKENSDYENSIPATKKI